MIFSRPGLAHELQLGAGSEAALALAIRLCDSHHSLEDTARSLLKSGVS